MELDDFKQAWKENKLKRNTNKDIMQMIQQKSYGPVEGLKRAFRKQMILMSILPVLIFLANAHDADSVLSSIMFWCYVAFCLGMALFAYYNYRIVDKLNSIDGILKSNLEKQINILEKRMQLNIIQLRIVMMFFIVLTEVVPYLQHFRMLDKWHSLHPLIRFGSYAALLILQYFASRALSKRKFGNHLNQLRELVKEME